MQTEEQERPVDSPENMAEGESTESKTKRGGKRAGAGRKPNLAKHLLKGVKPATAAEALEGIDVRAIVHDLLKNGSKSVKLQTLTVLWDRIYGKPKQEIGVSGGLTHAHVRDPLLSALPKEDLEALVEAYNGVMAKHRLPAASIAPEDGPQNQTKSDSEALTVEVVPEAEQTV